MYGVDIKKEIDSSVQDYKQGNWYDLGYQLGEASAQVFLGEPAQAYIRTTRILQGIVREFDGQFSFDNLLGCVGNELTAAAFFDAGFQTAKIAIHDRKIDEVWPAILEIFQGYETAKDGL